MIQLKITLKGVKPPIWRRVLVSEKMNLLAFHDLIQCVMGWQNYHLHIFEIDGMKFVNTWDWEEDADNYQDDSRALLGDLIPRFVQEGGRFNYTYDLGDGWQHEITVEKILPDATNQKLPQLIAGKRACPPEDVGGTRGYEYFLEAIRDPENPDHDNYIIWVGEFPFDPESFQVDEVNRALVKCIRQADLERNTTWPIGSIYYNFDQVTQNDWTRSISKADKADAEALPLRKDMITLVQYLVDHEVKGTAATGNFPLKHIRAMTAGFVDPPALDRPSGKRARKLRSEDDVPILKWMHVLACLAGLIHGGESLPWKVTGQGLDFLTLQPEQQVWWLSSIWFYEVNWLYLIYYDLEVDSFAIKQVVIDRFLSYPVEQLFSTEHVIKDFEGDFKKRLKKRNREEAWDDIKYSLGRMVFAPLARLGILSLEQEEISPGEFYIVESIRVTRLGHSLLTALRPYFFPLERR